MQTIQEYLNSQQIELVPSVFLVDILLTSLAAYILGRIYIKHGKSISNRRQLAGIFILLSLTTMMIISIIKHSISLSLGLVGALSIVRFRSAIKEPEELVYIFLSISLGLGFGAGQRYITLVFFVAITIILIFKAKLSRSSGISEAVLLTVSSDETFDKNKIIEKIDSLCNRIDIRRVEKEGESSELGLIIEVKNSQGMIEIPKIINEMDPRLNVSVVDSQGLFS